MVELLILLLLFGPLALLVFINTRRNRRRERPAEAEDAD
jgi:hypothetical protein